MPLYEYLCSSCNQRFERIESFSSDPLRECPECGATARRQLGVPALQFKGSGWYVTDYGRGSAPSTAPASPAPAESAETSRPSKDSGSTCCAGKCCAD